MTELELERERTRRLFGLLALAAITICAIAVLYVVGVENASAVAMRLEGFATAIIGQMVVEMVRARRDSTPAPSRRARRDEERHP